MNIPHSKFDSVGFIAEVKTQSPFGFRSTRSFDDLLAAAVTMGDMVSIHVCPEWGGSPSLIDRAYDKCSKHNIPILAKGLDINTELAHECIKRGANHVLCHNPHHQHNFEQGVVWLELPAHGDFEYMKLQCEHVYVVNSRDPRTGQDVPDSWNYARRLHPDYKTDKIGGGILVQASKIRTVKDVKKDANMFIVGEHLLEFIQSMTP